MSNIITKSSNKQLWEEIRNGYFYSEVTSGEYIYSLKFDKDLYVEDIKNAIDDFLEWDDSNEGDWVIHETENYYEILNLK